MKRRWIFIIAGMGGIICFPVMSIMAIGLKSSVPRPHQILPAGNQEIHLIYDHEFDPFRSRLLLKDQSGQPILIPATTSLNHREVKTVYPLKVGKYTLQWYVWSWKGEESSGEIPFEITASAPSHSTASLNPAPAAIGQKGKAIAKQAPNN